MPLLRLLHQITTMFQNVRETQMELREQRPVQNVDSNVIHKNSSSSGSDIPDQIGGRGRARIKIEKLDHQPEPEELPQPLQSTPIANNATNTMTTTSSAKASTSRTQSFAQRFKSVRGNYVFGTFT